MIGHQLAQNQQIPIAKKTIVTILQLAQIHLQRKAAYILAATVFDSWQHPQPWSLVSKDPRLL